MVKWLVQAGADVNKPADDGSTPFMCWCRSGEDSGGVLNVMLERGGDTTARDAGGKTALMHLCGSREAVEDSVRLLVDHGADVSAKDERGMTPWLHLCKRGTINAELVELMVDTCGANVNARNTSGELALALYCRSKRVNRSGLEALLDRGADVNATNEDGNTVLMCLCMAGNATVDLVRLLLDRGADATASSPSGMTSLLHLCKAKTAEAGVVKLLLDECGVDVNARTTYGLMALMLYCHFKEVRADILEILLDHGADVNAINLDGTTPLMCLFMGGNATLELVKLSLRGNWSSAVRRYWQRRATRWRMCPRRDSRPGRERPEVQMSGLYKIVAGYNAAELALAGPSRHDWHWVLSCKSPPPVLAVTHVSTTSLV